MKKIISMLLCVCLLLGSVPMALAAQEQSYLALGDSITAGTGLNEGEKAFPQILAENNGWILNNQGVNGMTADLLYATLCEGAMDEAVANADLITLTIGGNDLLDLLYEVVTASYNEMYEPDIVPDDVVVIMANSADPRYIRLLIVTMDVMQGDEATGRPPFAEREDFLAEIDIFIENLNLVMGYLREKNPDAPVLIPTQYNPYKNFTGMYQLVADCMDAAARKLNDAIVANAEQGGYLVADVFTAFEENTENLCNATMIPMDLDFHPNAAGHGVMAGVFQSIIDQFPAPEPEETEPVETEPVETEPVETEPVETEPVETEPVETEPVETEPVESEPVETEPVETEPVETEPVETEPVETEPIVTEPVETEPVETEPEETEPSEPIEPTEPSEPEPVENPFEDVKEEDYFFDSVLWALENKITVGVSDTRFGYELGCTRAQVVTFLWRAAGEPEPETENNPFTDVTEDAYYYKAVLWAAENGITAGMTPTTFGPDAVCTRGQVVTFLWRSAGKPEPESMDNPFTDVAEGEYYLTSVLWAVEQGITVGMGNNAFAPANTCTRAQVVTFLYRAVKD